MGIQILKKLELIHNAGYVYNDLRLRNIIIDEDSVKLIDYGNSLEYIDNDGKHSSNNLQNKFKGNSIIATLNVM